MNFPPGEGSTLKNVHHSNKIVWYRRLSLDEQVNEMHPFEVRYTCHRYFQVVTQLTPKLEREMTIKMPGKYVSGYW